MIAVRPRIIAAIGAAVALLVAIVIILALSSRLDLRTIERDKARDAVQLEQRAHVQSILNYRKASAAAQLAADANVARVVAEQGDITERTAHDYQDRLAAAAARLAGVRAQLAARTDLRSTDLVPMSIASEAACNAYGGGSCDALLAKLAIAERQAANLVNLRQWVRDQAAVQVTAEPATK